MNKAYIHLFKEMARTNEVLAEKVLESDIKDKDPKAIEAATSIRKEYSDLYDKISNIEKENSEELFTKADFARLLVGAYMILEQLNSKKNAIEKSIQGYNIDIIPKLDRILNEANTDEECLALANEIFEIIEDN